MLQNMLTFSSLPPPHFNLLIHPKPTPNLNIPLTPMPQCPKKKKKNPTTQKEIVLYFEIAKNAELLSEVLSKNLVYVSTLIFVLKVAAHAS